MGLEQVSVTPRVVVAIPAYRCERQICRVLAGFRDDPLLLSQLDNIVVIDNQSDDGTVVAAKRAIEEHGLQSQARVVRNARNYGLGGSHKVALGIARARSADLLAILHGDNQATTSELGSLLRAWKREPRISAVLGSRFMPGSARVGYAIERTAGNAILNVVYTLGLRRVTWDLGSGLNLFKVADLDPSVVASFSDGFTFNMDLLAYYAARRLRVRYLPITWTETDQVSNARNFRVAAQALRTLGRWKMLGLPHPSELSDYRSDPA